MDNELDKLANGLEQYNAAIHALGKKSNNDTQPLGHQVPEEAAYQAYDKPIASNEWWQKEQARLLAAAKWDESFGSGYPEEKRAYLEKWGPIAEQKPSIEQSSRVWSEEEWTKRRAQLEEEAKLRAQIAEQEMKGKDALGMMQEAYEHIHVHGPFTFLMNQNHNALRGCVTCGATWVGLMAGEAKGLVWHPVGEVPEEEDE